MGLIDRVLGTSEARTQYRNARAELAAATAEAIANQGGQETTRYLAANRAVATAEKQIPWWRRG